jgi:putative transposase
MLVGEASLRRAVREFADHNHHERNHQGLNNRLIVPLTEQLNHEGDKGCRERLGGYRSTTTELPRKSGRRRFRTTVA